MICPPQVQLDNSYYCEGFKTCTLFSKSEDSGKTLGSMLVLLPLQCLKKGSQHFSGEVSAYFQSQWPHTDNTLKEMIFMCAAVGLTEGLQSI